MDILPLKTWFLNERRELPWRHAPSPYAVWISEVMLQQTQVSVVIPYFERWMDRFPTVCHLAEASIEEVIKMWEGLGYYSRARCLHEGAKTIVNQFHGEIPSDPNKLAMIKGLGPYTIGAILSFAFHQKAAAVDGNVIRVLARYYNIDKDVGKQSTIKEIREKAQQLLPDEEPWIIAEGLIELGATVCTRKPRCTECPLKKSCQGFLEGVAQELPVKAKREATIFLDRAVAIVQCGDHYLIKKGQEGEIMHDLHEFPYWDIESGKIDNIPEKLPLWVNKKFGIATTIASTLPKQQHSFTKYRVKLYPYVLHCTKKHSIQHYQWCSKEQMQDMPFSSGHKRILMSMLCI